MKNPIDKEFRNFIQLIRNTKEGDENYIKNELIFRELARRKFKYYVFYMYRDFIFSNFNIEIMDNLQDVYEGKINRLLISLPPRHGKTFIASELFPSWCLGKTKGLEQVVNVSYGLKVSKNNAKNCLNIVKDSKFNIIFPEFKLDKDNQSGHDWKVINTNENGGKNGGYYAVGIGGSLTGLGFTLGIIDDPTKDRQTAESLTMQEKITGWYTSTFLTRKNKLVKNVSIIVIMTRWNTNDLVGFILENEKLGGDKFDKIVYPAINDKGEPLFPEKNDLDYYNKEKMNIGERDFEALYQQNPVKSMGSIFKKEYFKYYLHSDFDFSNALIKKDDIIWGIHVDPATSTNKKSDNTVIMLVGKHKITDDFYIWDLDSGTISPTDAYNRIFNMAFRAEIDKIKVQYISIEQVSINKEQTEFMRMFMEEMKTRGKYYTIYEYHPKENKQERIKYILEPLFQNGKIYFLNKDDSTRNQGYKTLEDELLKFPMMRHDDHPDTLAQSIVQLRDRKFISEQNIKERNEKIVKMRDRMSGARYNPITGKLM